MTDQEKKSGGSTTDGTSVVMVEQSTASRHKPYRPTDLQDESPPELHHKRSRAPAVPSVAEELKDSAGNTDLKEGKEIDSAVSSEKHKHNVAKKLSSTTKRRATSPEAISLAPLEVDVKRTDIITQPAQPIPAAVEPVPSDISDIDKKKMLELKDDVDSITEEIAELRTVDPTQKATEWDTEYHSQEYVPENQDPEDMVPMQRKLPNEIINTVDIKTETHVDPVVREAGDIVPLQRKLGYETVNEVTSTQKLKKKEISWNQSTYLDRVQLQDINGRSATWMLEQKASVGPCYKKTTPFGEPSGITISLPKKSLKNVNENIDPSKTGINITVSKRSFDRNLLNDFVVRNISDRIEFPRREQKTELKIEGHDCDNFLENLKGKLDNLRGRIKHVLHM